MSNNTPDRITLPVSDFDATVSQDGELTVDNEQIKGDVPESHEVTGYHLEHESGRNGGYVLYAVCEVGKE